MSVYIRILIGRGERGGRGTHSMEAGFCNTSFCAVVDGEVAWAVGRLPIGLRFEDSATLNLHGDVAASTDAAWFTFGVFHGRRVETLHERYPQISDAAKAKLRAVARYVEEYMDGDDPSDKATCVGRVRVMDTKAQTIVEGRMHAMLAPDHEAWCLKELVRIAANRIKREARAV